VKPGDLVKYASPISTSGLKRGHLIGVVIETGPTFEDSPESPLDIYEVDVYWTGTLGSDEWSGHTPRITQSNRWWAYMEDLIIISES